MGESGPLDRPASTRMVTGNAAAADHTCAGPSPATVTQVTVRASRPVLVGCVQRRRFMPGSLLRPCLTGAPARESYNEPPVRARSELRTGDACAGVLTRSGRGTMDTRPASNVETWPGLPLEAWSDTCATLHLWAQIVGKVRLAQTPWVNHAWHATLYVTARGVTTSPIPHGQRTFEMEFDFIAHQLAIRASDGDLGGFALEPMSVAVFYTRLLEQLNRLTPPVTVHKRPNELPEPIRFDLDHTHR